MPAAHRRTFLWLEGRWAVPWLTRPALPSVSRLVGTRWDRGVRLAENERQFHRLGERRPTEGVEQLLVRLDHVSNSSKV